jgi:hypothetical protein
VLDLSRLDTHAIHFLTIWRINPTVLPRPGNHYTFENSRRRRSVQCKSGPEEAPGSFIVPVEEASDFPDLRDLFISTGRHLSSSGKFEK